MTIICINGAPTCGKDTFVSLCQKYLLWCGNFSTVDFVKEIATECGWDGTKTLENRKFLSDLKDLLTKWDDVPYKMIVNRANNLPSTMDWIMFVDCREPAEIQKLKEGLNATTLLIRRPGDDEAETSNHADANVFNYEYDLTIENNSDIMDLEKKAKDFINYMRGAPHYEYNGL